MIRLHLRITILLACLATSYGRTVFATRDAPHQGWQMHNEPDHTTPFSFSILLKHQNTDLLRKRFEEVSDPNSPSYQKYSTKEEIQQLIKPDQQAFNLTYQWLRESGKNVTRAVEGASYIRVYTTVGGASEMLNTSFRHFVHSDTGLSLIRHIGEASHPSYLEDHIDIVAGVSEMLSTKSSIKTMPKNDGKKKRANFAYDYSFPITPAVLRSFYNASNVQGASSNNLQGIIAFDNFYSSKALNEFVSNFDITPGTVTNYGTNCISSGCDQGESNLDIQYMVSTGQNIATDFISVPSNYWILETFEETLPSLPKIPYVISISYGAPEFSQCGDYQLCSSLGYSTSTYISRSQTQFQALGSQGVSILVASGDSGASGQQQQTGNCPLDQSVYCYNDGCSATSSQCRQVLATATSRGSTVKVVFPTGYQSTSTAIYNAAQQWASANSACNVAFQGSSQLELYSTCACSSLTYGTFGGVTFSQYSYSSSNGPAFTPAWPGSDPYITSVGATTVQNGVETVGSIESGAVITSGGGFSQMFATPSYQTSVVAAWASRSSAAGNQPPSGTFSTSYRGFPDVAFNGHAYEVYNENSGSVTQNYADGTSASAPSLAGFISLLNDELLQKGKSTLGFLNPLLYQAYASNPTIFNDITTGNNRCTANDCCSYGFYATQGWDPASGLGSINIGRLYTYVLGNDYTFVQSPTTSVGVRVLPTVDRVTASTTTIAPWSMLMAFALLMVCI